MLTQIFGVTQIFCQAIEAADCCRSGDPRIYTCPGAVCRAGTAIQSHTGPIGRHLIVFLEKSWILTQIFDIDTNVLCQ